MFHKKKLRIKEKKNKKEKKELQCKQKQKKIVYKEYQMNIISIKYKINLKYKLLNNKSKIQELSVEKKKFKEKQQ